MPSFLPTSRAIVRSSSDALQFEKFANLSFKPRVRTDSCFVWKYIILWIAILITTESFTVHASNWESGCLSMELTNCEIKANSIVDLWQHSLSRELGLRLILYLPRAYEGWQLGFNYQREKSTVADIISGVGQAYTNYIYTQDNKTGVIWLHPKDSPYDKILNGQVIVRHPVLGAPMLSGVLGELENAQNVIYNGRRTAAISRTFNFPVDIPVGTYTIRDIVNLCCVAGPATTFYITDNLEGLPVSTITPDLIGTGEHGNQPLPIALIYWENEVSHSVQIKPTTENLVNYLASGDEAVRQAARRYISVLACVDGAGDFKAIKFVWR
jgi:hypothetical protein